MGNQLLQPSLGEESFCLGEKNKKPSFYEARMGSCAINDEFTLFSSFPPICSWSHCSCFQLSSGLCQAPWDGCSDSHNWPLFHFSLNLASQEGGLGGARGWLVVLEWVLLRLLSAEGSGWDLSSFKAVILEVSIAGGGEANVLAGRSVFGKSKCSFAFSPFFISSQTFHFRTVSFLFKWV